MATIKKNPRGNQVPVKKWRHGGTSSLLEGCQMMQLLQKLEKFYKKTKYRTA